jgi:hypothetical protein
MSSGKRYLVTFLSPCRLEISARCIASNLFKPEHAIKGSAITACAEEVHVTVAVNVSGYELVEHAALAS